MPPTSPTPLQAASAWSSARSITDATARVTSSINAQLDTTPDLALVIATELSSTDLRQARDQIRAELNPKTLLGTTAPALIAAEGTLTETPAIAVLALIGVHAHPFTLDALEQPGETFPASIDHLAQITGTADDTRATIVLANPKGMAIQAMLPRLNASRGLGRTHPILGTTIEDATLLLNDDTIHQGLVGVTLSGDFRVDAITSQGATPVSENLVVTRAKGNLIQGLGGRPALEALARAHQVAGTDTPLLLARLIDENSPTRGRGDYLMRTIVGMDEQSGSIAADELIRAGQTVRFHRADRAMGEADLAMLLDGHKLDGPPAAALAFSGSLRKIPDGVVLARAFAPAKPGSHRSRSGQELAGVSHTLPILGPAGAGEIGPIRSVSYLHRQSAVVALFRAPEKNIKPQER